MLKLKTITTKGFVISFDAMISGLILLTIVMLLFSVISSNAIIAKNKLNENEKELFLFSLSEAIIKNRNTKQPSIGSVYYNSEKQRVESNVVDLKLLKKITPKKFGKFYFSELYTKTTTEKNVFFKDEKNNCLVQERFIILKNITEQKTILGVVLCEN